MSADLIKSERFAELYTLAPTEAGGAARYSSAEARVHELEERLEELAAERDRAVEEAGRRAREQAEAEARREHGDSVSALRETASALRERMQAEHEIAYDEILTLATAVAAKVLRREISRDDTFVVRLVRRCLRRIANGAKVRVRLNAHDVDAVRTALAAPGDADGPRHEIVVVEDRRVDRGGCIVETPDFVVDGRLGTQVAAADQALRGEGT